MLSFLEVLSQQVMSMTFWEVVAVVLAVIYLLLARIEHSGCWPAALISTAIYTVIFWQVNLLMDSALNVFYMLMAVYGWCIWQGYRWPWVQNDSSQKAAEIHIWPLRFHLCAAAVIALATLISGWLLSRYTEAAWPYLDSFTTWASVLTTFMLAWKVLENWLYWLVIDAVALYLYIDRELYLTAALFGLYLILAFLAYLTWKRSMNSQDASFAADFIR